MPPTQQPCQSPKQEKRKNSFGDLASSSAKIKSEHGNPPDPPGATRWNIDFRLPPSHAKLPKTDPRHVIRSGTDPESDKQRRWYSGATRTRQTRSICWSEIGGLDYKTLPKIEDRCFVCKIDLEVQPCHRTSYPFNTWETSVAKGCQDCGQIVRGVRMFAEIYDLQTDRLHIGTLKVSSERQTTPIVQRILIGVFWLGALGDMSEHLEFTRTSRSDPPVKSEPPLTPFNPEIYKEDVFLSAQKLIQACSVTHRHCLSPSQPPFLPTRLLEIQSEPTPTIKLLPTSLLSSETTNSHYLALSYCWGNPPYNPLRLTVSTSQSLHDGIPTSSLPLLFQDLVSLSQHLGVKLIWIDALCIQQDDPLDWEREAAVMGAIYRNAWPVVGATSARNSSQPLAPQPFQNINIPISGMESGGECKGVWDNVLCSTQGGSVTWPLHERGWCFQEMILARRFLDFDSNGLQLHCCNGDVRAEDKQHDEDGAALIELPRYTRWEPADFRRPWAFRHFWSRLLDSDPNKQQVKETDMRRVWREVLQMYTNRRLTYSSDLLPALSGIASQYLNKVGSGDTYCAGLWKSSFMQDLCWTANHEAVPLEAGDKAPSWSWASICGSVDYEYTDLGEQKTGLVDVACDQKGTNLFGEVKRGHAVLEGPVFTCLLTVEYGKWAVHQSEMHHSRARTFTPDVVIEVVEFRNEGASGIMKSSANRATKAGGRIEVEKDVRCEVLAIHLFDIKYGQGLFMILGWLDPKGIVCQRLGILEAPLSNFYGAKGVDTNIETQELKQIKVV
ncbi:hypothetical protein FSARC_14070 [Fusarium sarcochroum]|uniref:Heterokaryon incompatibility domain-containing protein n=1 Tax=Fusarium sarcochroum TaxID=1208366 RepID=A0A8H4SWM6_9HYPO|nr:hypothetical protein FSARC_14070 [Fusarium sarcochroum]